jgi:predicted Zn-dependent peptidase
MNSRQTLTNGFNIVYELLPENCLTSIHLYCKVGSIHEPPNLRGVSHLIEHMCFKGTALHPTAADIFGVSVGSEFNAYTDKEMTCYYIKCLNRHVPDCIRLLHDMVFHSCFRKTGFDKEKNVVIEENTQDADDTDTIMEEKMNSLLFHNTVYAFPVDTLRYHSSRSGSSSLELNEVKKYYKTHYVPNNMVLSVVSSIPWKTVASLIIPIFEDPVTNNTNISTREGKLVEGKLVEGKLVEGKLVEGKLVKGLQKIIHKNKHTTNISLGFVTCPYSSDDKSCLELFSAILGGGMNSYLFTIMREQNGLTYHSEVNTEYFQTTGSFVVTLEEDSNKIMRNGEKKGVLPLLMDCFRHFVKKGVTCKQLKDAKEIVYETMIRDAEDSYTIAEYNAMEFMYCEKRIPYMEQFHKKYKHITIENINAVIQKYFIL